MDNAPQAVVVNNAPQAVVVNNAPHVEVIAVHHRWKCACYFPHHRWWTTDSAW